MVAVAAEQVVVALAVEVVPSEASPVIEGEDEAEDEVVSVAPSDQEEKVDNKLYILKHPRPRSRGRPRSKRPRTTSRAC